MGDAQDSFQLKEALGQIKQRLDLKSLISNGQQQSSGKLDGSIKKNTSFIKKLKSGITFNQLDSLRLEMSQLKVDKYLDEIVSSISDNIYKTSSDVWAAVVLSVDLYLRFPELQLMLSQSLLKSFGSMLKAVDKEKEEQSRLSKQRSTLKFLMELLMVGMVPEDKAKNLVPNLLKFLLANDKELKNAQIAIGFCKSYALYLLPNQVMSSNGIEFILLEKRDLLMNEQQREKSYHLLSDYFEKVKSALLKEHIKLQNMEKYNEDSFIAKGEVNQEKVDILEKRESSLDKFKFGAQTMASALYLKMCEFPEKEKQHEFTIGIAENLPKDGVDGDTIWEDLESKQFYESITDLANQVPVVLLGQKQIKEKEINIDVEFSTEEKDINEMEQNIDKSLLETGAEDETPEVVGTKSQMDEIIAQLTSPLSKEAIDQIAVKFAFINNKGTRKRLAQALLAVPRQRIDLLPYYGRLLATLDPYMPALTTLVVTELERSFRYHQYKKEQVFFEEKVKNIRFIGELVKFQIISNISVFHCFKVLLDRFGFHNIEICCALLESCGRFLYFKPETQLTMAKFVYIIN